MQDHALQVYVPLKHVCCMVVCVCARSVDVNVSAQAANTSFVITDFVVLSCVSRASFFFSL